MNRSYTNLIEPIIEYMKPKHIIEIGTKSGDNTKKILRYCIDNNATLSVIDPAPDFNIEQFKKTYGKFNFYKDLSLNALKKIHSADMILVDGDHNYYTVFNELELIELKYGKDFPVIFFHDVSWPYARRDLYYNPDTIPKSEINEYKKIGIHPERETLVKGGINSELNNAILENTPKNGVLTAIEDFLQQSAIELYFNKVNYKNGIGFLCKKDDESLITLFDELSNNKKLTEEVEYDYNKILSSYSIYKYNKNIELDNLNQSLEKSSHENNILKMINNEVNRKIENLYITKGKLEQKLTDKENYIAEIDVTIEKNNRVIVELEEKQIKINQDIVACNIEIELLNKELAEKNDLTTELNNRLLKKEEELTNLSDKIESIKQNLKVSESQLYKNNELLFELEEEVDQKNQLISLLYNRILLKEEDIVNLRITLDSKISLITQLKKEKEVLKYEVNDKNNVINKLQNELRKNQEIISKLNIEIKEKVTKINEKVTEIEKVKVRSNEKDKLIESLRGSNSINEKLNSEVNEALTKNNNSQALSLLYEYTRYKNGLRNKEIFEEDYPLSPSGIRKLVVYSKLLLRGGLKNAIKLNENINLLKDSDLFDVNYYLLNYPDVYYSGISPYIHYLYYGGFEERNPSQIFDSCMYLTNNSDVKEDGINPLIHYLKWGNKEGRLVPLAVKTDTKRVDKVINQKTQSNADVVKPKKVNNVSKLYYSKEVSEQKRNYILNKNKEFLQKEYNIPDNPLISIVILNRNGSETGYLQTLFRTLETATIYKRYELVIVDNNSSDNSIEVIKSNLDKYKINLIINKSNLSFSEANNKAVDEANGDYIVFMNNDIEPTYGWLSEILHLYFSKENVGAIGSKLIYPNCPQNSLNAKKSFMIQHAGIGFREEIDFIRPYNMENNVEPFNSRCNTSEKRAGVTAACLFIKKDLFLNIEGFDEKYIYGYEDVDINLKIVRAGFDIYYCSSSLLFHYEFGTQSKNSNDEVRIRRLNNYERFKTKWYRWLRQEILSDKLYNTQLYTQNSFKIGIAVTETGEDATAGDYFTGLELGTSLEKLGYTIEYLARKEGDWYNLNPEFDVVISLLEAYDVTKIKNKKENLITIAWARNWFDRWSNLSYIQEYNMIFASSETACNYMSELLDREVMLFPIATNSLRFEVDRFNKNEKYSSDYVFTGSYWNDPREIIDILSPQELPYNFKVFGMNWDKVEKLKKHFGGFVNYKDIPKVYNNTKIVIDDANRVTKPYGAVNSRVYDALAAGRLVLTNGVLGAEETFKGLLPTFTDKDELHFLLEYYLSNKDEYDQKVKELQKFVLENHTYDIRAKQLRELLSKKRHKVIIKTPVPKYEQVEQWGDYHFAVAMKKQFEKHGIDTLIQILPEWNDEIDVEYDIVIVLRGLSYYEPKPYHYNIMWNISHPDKVTLAEYNKYDQVYIASEKWAKKINKESIAKVDSMLQCTDIELFYPQEDKNINYELLFVGNSRKIFRKVIKDLLPTDRDLSVFGTFWESIIDLKYIKGKNIPNRQLSKHYTNSKILLNDHWDDMREKGFISNRIFDALASGAFVISDYMDEIEELFGESVEMYTSKKDLKDKIDFYLSNEDERKKHIEKGLKLVRENHTFEHRVNTILKDYCETYNQSLRL